MKSQKRQLRPYQIVSFVNEIDKKGKRTVECVPSSWLSYDKGLGSLVVRYMAPPYKEEDKLLIRTFIQNREDPPESWPSYAVTLQGDAKTHAKGLKRVKKLSDQEYAYTTMSEDMGEKNAQEITTLIKNKKSHDAKTIKNKLSRRNLSSESDDSGSASSDESPSNSETPAANFRSKNKNSSQKNVSKKSAAQVPVGKKKNNASSKIVDASLVCKQPLTSTSYPLNTENATDQEKVANKNGSDDAKIPSARQGFQKNESRPLEDTANNLVSDLNGNEPVQRALTKIIAVMKFQSEEIRELRHSLERFMKMPSSEMTPNGFMKKHEVQKLTSVDDFLVFEGHLKDDADFQKDFTGAINCIVESDMKKTLNAIIKKFFTQQFAMNCTAVRESKKAGKLMLKGTAFYEKLFEFVRRMHSNEEGITEKTFYQSLSSCLNNAKDWDGGRKMRRK